MQFIEIDLCFEFLLITNKYRDENPYEQRNYVSSESDDDYNVNNNEFDPYERYHGLSIEIFNSKDTNELEILLATTIFLKLRPNITTRHIRAQQFPFQASIVVEYPLDQMKMKRKHT